MPWPSGVPCRFLVQFVLESYVPNGTLCRFKIVVTVPVVSRKPIGTQCWLVIAVLVVVVMLPA